MESKYCTLEEQKQKEYSYIILILACHIRMIQDISAVRYKQEVSVLYFGI